jgi:5,10-methylenetetrahydromethanopterin reductase
MNLSAAFAPGPDAIEYAVLAERLGYERAWFYDSPALYADIWVTMARVADRTSRIGLGTAVLIPNLRHPMTQAAAIATLEEQAPGRLAVALGTGFTGRLAMGQKPLSWAYMRRYLRQLRALLAGETVEIEGAQAQMIHPDGYVAGRPVRTPIIVGANGPKGLEVARELGDGVMCILNPQPGFDWCAVLTFGTVLEDGEEPSERVVEAAGPGLAALYHSQLAAMLPRGEEYRAMLEQFPAETRHLRMHERHFVGINDHDRPFLDPATVAQLSFTGTRAQLRARLKSMEAAGATEVMVHTAGPDIERELTAFASVGELQPA